MKIKSYTRKSFLKRLGMLMLLAAICFVVLLPVDWPAMENLYIRWELLNANSVELIHYNPWSAHVGREMVYATKELEPKGFSTVSDAFPLCLDTDLSLGMSKCTFDPHHRIVIKSWMGTTVVRVCFLCDHVQIGDKGYIVETPPAWRDGLRKFFTDEGMPFIPERYRQDFQDDMEKNPPR